MNEETEVVYEVRLRVLGNVPDDVQLVNEAALMQAILGAARSADADDDYTVAIVGVEVRRVQ
jgi:hypothetical protein